MTDCPAPKSSPTAPNPRECLGIAERCIDSPQVGAQLARVILNVADTINVQFAARESPVREPRRSLQLLLCFSGERVNHLLPANEQIGERFVLRETGADRRAALVAAAVMKIAERKRLLIGR